MNAKTYIGKDSGKMHLEVNGKAAVDRALNPKPETHGCMECGAEIPCDRTWCGHCQNFDEIPSE